MDKPFSVIDELYNCYSQHGTREKAEDSMYDLKHVFIGVTFEISEQLNWNESGVEFRLRKQTGLEISQMEVLV